LGLYRHKWPVASARGGGSAWWTRVFSVSNSPYSWQTGQTQSAKALEYPDNTRVTKPIRHLGPKQPAICGDINPKAFFRGVVDDFVHENRAAGAALRPLTRALGTHCRASQSSGTPGYIFCHAFDFVVVRPAVPAIEIAFVLDK